MLPANVLAWPAGYWIVERWLRGFAYKAPLRLWIFLLAGGLAATIAMTTIILQSLRAASSNPAATLRCE